MPLELQYLPKKLVHHVASFLEPKNLIALQKFLKRIFVYFLSHYFWSHCASN